MTEKYIPKVGDKVADVGRHRLSRGLVSRVLKRYVEVSATSVGPCRVMVDRKFSLPHLSEAGSRWDGARIEPWSKAHDERIAHERAVSAIRKAADDAFATGAARAELEHLPAARLLEAAEFLRALVAEAKLRAAGR